MASAAAIQGADSVQPKLLDTFAPSDFLNNFGAGMFAGFGSSSATSSAGMSARDWGNHTQSINFAGASSLSIKQVLLWGSVAALGFWLFKKIKKVG